MFLLQASVFALYVQKDEGVSRESESGRSQRGQAERTIRKSCQGAYGGILRAGDSDVEGQL